jgi:uncharacterized small protein (DUF1192 family)
MSPDSVTLFLHDGDAPSQTRRHEALRHALLALGLGDVEARTVLLRDDPLEGRRAGVRIVPSVVLSRGTRSLVLPGAPEQLTAQRLAEGAWQG